MPGPVAPRRQQAVFTGGCFWTLEAVFRRLRGVQGVRPGFVWMAAGLPPKESPQRYPVEKMEGVWVEWDPDALGLGVLVEVLLSITSSSLVSWEGISEMSGARSAVFVEGLTDAGPALAVIEHHRNAPTGLPVYTEVIPWLPAWVAAPAFDLNYFEKNPKESFCRSIVQPKMDRVAQRFAAWWEPRPVC